MDKQEPHMVRSRLAYSLGAFGHDAFFALLSTYFMMYVTGHLFTSSDKGFDNRMVGYVTAIIMILRIVELLIDPLIGNAIDRTNTKWGKFKPWVVGGGVISVVLLLFPAGHPSQLLGQIHRIKDAFRRVQPTAQAAVGFLIDDPVIFYRRLPAESSD